MVRMTNLDEPWIGYGGTPIAVRRGAQLSTMTPFLGRVEALVCVGGVKSSGPCGHGETGMNWLRVTLSEKARLRETSASGGAGQVGRRTTHPNEIPGKRLWWLMLWFASSSEQGLDSPQISDARHGTEVVPMRDVTDVIERVSINAPIHPRPPRASGPSKFTRSVALLLGCRKQRKPVSVGCMRRDNGGSRGENDGFWDQCLPITQHGGRPFGFDSKTLITRAGLGGFPSVKSKGWNKVEPPSASAPRIYSTRDGTSVHFVPSPCVNRGMSRKVPVRAKRRESKLRRGERRKSERLCILWIRFAKDAMGVGFQESDNDLLGVVSRTKNAEIAASDI
ncbi:hypothetical protein BJ322DRAFT_1024591 [Thelephora terrestris]|uniref:Uncharacterized protein n=1 Tax=Thelephora terrestris TaxID=56493 RepID=A0A9P6H7D6_9AGAM|nr:hypothetical protein BJ322DRAFT_1024591 [Thelephora terrestris]